jgi:glutathione S-transferase
MDIGDGTIIGQSAAIMRYIGKKTGLYPTDDALAALVDSIIDHVSKTAYTDYNVNINASH